MEVGSRPWFRFSLLRRTGQQRGYGGYATLQAEHCQYGAVAYTYGPGLGRAGHAGEM